MIGNYLNFFSDGQHSYYDLMINQNDNVEMYIRLNGVIFEGVPTTQELIDRCLEIIFRIDETIIIEKIYLGYGDTSIY